MGCHWGPLKSTCSVAFSASFETLNFLEAGNPCSVGWDQEPYAWWIFYLYFCKTAIATTGSEFWDQWDLHDRRKSTVCQSAFQMSKRSIQVDLVGLHPSNCPTAGLTMGGPSASTRRRLESGSSSSKSVKRMPSLKKNLDLKIGSKPPKTCFS